MGKKKRDALNGMRATTTAVAAQKKTEEGRQVPIGQMERKH